MKNMNITQMVITGISVIAIVAGIATFTLYRGGIIKNERGSVVMWGTVSQEKFSDVLNQLDNQGIEIKNFTYVQKELATFDQELLQAIADNTGPDLVLLNEKQILKNQRRLQNISFDVFPLRQYQDMFLEEALLLTKGEGVIGLPFLVDPLVLYYNKDMLINAGFSKPPQTWTEVLALAPVLTNKDSSFNVSKSTIALGAFDNINNAKDIYWTLALQAGTPVISSDTVEGREIYKSVFTEDFNYTLNPAYAATNFYSQFSNPTKTVYSWNRSLPNSQTKFISGDLAFYIGYASELSTIQKLNPNLNFDMALMPQSQNTSRKTTYGLMHILAIPNGSSNPQAAFSVMNELTSQQTQKVFANFFGMASVRTDILNASDTQDKYRAIIDRSAIMAKGVLEPDQEKTTDIVRTMISQVESGQFEISEAIQYANQKLIQLINEI